MFIFNDARQLDYVHYKLCRLVMKLTNTKQKYDPKTI